MELINNSEKYYGKYVGLKSFQEKDVISFNDDPKIVSDELKEMGIDCPVIFYVPKKDEIFIF